MRTPKASVRVALPLLLMTVGVLQACGGSEGAPDSPVAEEATEPETNALKPSPVEGVTFRQVESNGITMRVAEMGEGPLVLFAHGWPESWYSWRHQIPAVAGAGFQAIAPDMRGYGGTDQPQEIDAYDSTTVCRDLIGLIDAYGQEQAVLVGHDWGAAIVWQCSLLHPDRVRAVAAMSVPWSPRGPNNPLEQMKAGYGDNFFYMLYFQELDEDGVGIADAEFDADPRALFSRIYSSPDTPRDPPTITDPKRAAGGWIGRLGTPTELPPWFTESDLDYYVSEFERAGFRGGINYYRNIGRSWELTPQLDGATIAQPSLFIAGEQDSVIGGATKEQLEASLEAVAPGLVGVHLIPETGHWVQQERAEEVNALLLGFLGSLE